VATIGAYHLRDRLIRPRPGDTNVIPPFDTAIAVPATANATMRAFADAVGEVVATALAANTAYLTRRRDQMGQRPRVQASFISDVRHLLAAAGMMANLR
jgi:hypothetical protein